MAQLEQHRAENGERDDRPEPARDTARAQYGRIERLGIIDRRGKRARRFGMGIQATSCTIDAAFFPA
jgi:hypothetical protein